MARIAGGIVAVLVLIAGIGAIYVYQRISSIEVVKVTDDVHVIYGLGSNVGILRTSEGSVVVDTMTFTLQGREVRERAEALAGPVRAIVNTHYHLDHTHGNPAFASGLPVLSTGRTRGYLDKLDADYWKGDAAGTLPNQTIDGEKTITMGGKTVRLLHPGRGHTDGDLIALFVEDRVVHTGDLFSNGRFPSIDLEAGGSLREWVATLDRILELDFDQVIPGHGPLTDRAGLQDFQRFIQQLAQVATDAETSGKSLEETLATAEVDTTGREPVSIPFVLTLDRDFLVKRAWEEGTGTFERVKLE